MGELEWWWCYAGAEEDGAEETGCESHCGAEVRLSWILGVV